MLLNWGQWAVDYVGREISLSQVLVMSNLSAIRDRTRPTMGSAEPWKRVSLSCPKVPPLKFRGLSPQQEGALRNMLRLTNFVRDEKEASVLSWNVGGFDEHEDWQDRLSIIIGER